MKEGGYNTRPSFNKNASLISVITVCYNAADTLSQCIQSVVDQQFKDIEYIVIDGGSTDGTLEILEVQDDRIAYWRSEPDRGIYHAMNKALKYANGKWLLFLGADDLLLPGISQMAQVLKDKHTIYYSKVLYEESPVGRKIGGYFLAKNNICHQSILYPKTVFEKYRFEEKYRLYADHYLNMQCWADPQFKWQYCDILTAKFALDGASSAKDDPAFEADKAKWIKKYFGQLAYWRYRFKQLKSNIKG